MLKIQSEKLSSCLACHAFFGKKGGKSSGAYFSLNCSKFVGDCEDSVVQNLEIVKNDFHALRLITLKQSHTSSCVVVDFEASHALEADAMVTKTQNVAIGILTADCAPILFLDEENKVIGAAHAGWRGAVSGIIESTVHEMVNFGCNLQKIKVAIGPCISKESYEINEDFVKDFHGRHDCFYQSGSKVYFDLPKYCYNRLVESGLIECNIDVIGVDSYANYENYFSYRFANKCSNGVCGRNISAIMLNG